MFMRCVRSIDRYSVQVEIYQIFEFGAVLGARAPARMAAGRT
jgi:hypothetical protein